MPEKCIWISKGYRTASDDKFLLIIMTGACHASVNIQQGRMEETDDYTTRMGKPERK